MWELRQRDFAEAHQALQAVEHLRHISSRRQQRDLQVKLPQCNILCTRGKLSLRNLIGDTGCLPWRYKVHQ
jgi:hypothetical protein